MPPSPSTHPVASDPTPPPTCWRHPHVVCYESQRTIWSSLKPTPTQVGGGQFVLVVGPTGGGLLVLVTGGVGRWR